MPRPLTRPDEGPRERCQVRLTGAMIDALDAVQADYGLASRSDAVDHLIRIYGALRPEIAGMSLDSLREWSRGDE